MSEKSELSYLLEALERHPDDSYNLESCISRAIERRKQDLAKAVDNGDVQGLRGGYQYECDTRKDNTPKGGGDVEGEVMKLRYATVDGNTLSGQVERSRDDPSERPFIHLECECNEFFLDAGEAKAVLAYLKDAIQLLDSHPKGGGDVKRYKNRIVMDENGPHDELTDNDNGDWVQYSDYDALLAERDAARAELKEAVGFLKELMPTNIELICGECGGEATKCRRLHPDCVFPRIRAFLARVGKQS